MDDNDKAAESDSERFVKCDYCQGAFAPKREKQRFCSTKCHRNYHNAKAMGYKEHALQCPLYKQEHEDGQ